MLRFEAQATAVLIGLSAFAFYASEEISAIKLDAGLGREDAQDPARLGVADLRGQGQLARLIVEHQIVVIAFARLVGELVNPLPDFMELTEIKGGAGNRRDFTGRDQRFIN